LVAADLSRLFVLDSLNYQRSIWRTWAETRLLKFPFVGKLSQIQFLKLEASRRGLQKSVV